MAAKRWVHRELKSGWKCNKRKGFMIWGYCHYFCSCWLGTLSQLIIDGINMDWKVIISKGYIGICIRVLLVRSTGERKGEPWLRSEARKPCALLILGLLMIFPVHQRIRYFSLEA